MDNKNNTAIASAAGRGNLTRLGATRRPASTVTKVSRARDARRELRPRSERFAHLKQMHD